MLQNSPKQNIVKNQHYISESLLGHFTNKDNKLFEALLSEKKIYPTSPNSSMSAKFIYEDAHLKVNTIENYFNKVETEVAPMVKELIETIKKHKKQGCLFFEIKNLTESLLPAFIVFYYRSGALLTEFSSLNSKNKILHLSEKILNKSYVQLLAETIKRCYKFAIIESDEDFLMSDQFICTAGLKIKSNFTDISNRHIGIKETLILIPVSSSYYIAYWHTDDEIFLIEDEMNFLSNDSLELINQTIINNSYIKCIGSKQANLSAVLAGYQMELPSQIFMGYGFGKSSGAIRKKEVFFYNEDKKAFKMLTSHILSNYLEAGRNDECPCGSGKKFKRCCSDCCERIKIPWQNITNQANIKTDIYSIPNALCVESPIAEWSNF